MSIEQEKIANQIGKQFAQELWNSMYTQQQDIIKRILQEQFDQPLNTQEAMSFMHVTNKSTLHRYHKQGLRYIKGSPNLYLKKDILEFLEGKRI